MTNSFQNSVSLRRYMPAVLRQNGAGSHSFTLVWAEMRESLSLPETYQLYSLRDSGINSMLKANVNDLDVMQAAGHSDLKMTTRYANHIDSNLINRLNEQAPAF